ncbi:MAG: enoyl-CoA hydratase/isomerase family protein [Actinobacteria bacterium]|nr:enoyl-CoA hydratase/isomerase family protein [Actinomycetota bacterium]
MKTIDLRIVDGVAVITLSRPSVLNAISPEMLGELEESLLGLEANRDARVVVIIGSGKAFSAGADVNWFRGSGAQEVAAFAQEVHRTFGVVENLTKPVVAAVNGLAVGGGLELALACDLVIASTRAEFALSEIRLGIIPGGGGTQRLPRAIGVLRAKYMMMTGRRISAEEAMEFGIVNEIVGDGDGFLEEAVGFGRALAARSPLALTAIKKSVNLGSRADFETGLQIERLWIEKVFESETARRLIEQFVRE